MLCEPLALEEATKGHSPSHEATILFTTAMDHTAGSYFFTTAMTNNNASLPFSVWRTGPGSQQWNCGCAITITTWSTKAPAPVPGCLQADGPSQASMFQHFDFEPPPPSAR